MIHEDYVEEAAICANKDPRWDIVAKALQTIEEGFKDKKRIFYPTKKFNFMEPWAATWDEIIEPCDIHIYENTCDSKRKCNCSISLLMAQGCKCGGE